MGETETEVAVVVAAAAPPLPGRCENCAAELQGEYCHACGQSVHSPLRHAGHALEEIFESFWHLDGRIFRTLRDLLVPGRVARGYIAGHRARYIAPLRLFVILSLLTFFVAQYSVEVDDDTIIQIDPETGVNVSGADGGREPRNSFAQARTVAEVERIRDRELAEIAEARELVPAGIPGARSGIDAGMRAMRDQAQRRIEELRRAAPAETAGEVVARPAGQGSASGTDSRKTAAAAPPAAPSTAAATPPATRPAAAKPPAEEDRQMAWDARANPVDLAWLPAFANQWLTEQSDRASRNAVQIRKDPQRWLRAVIGAVPSTLFLLVPVFALLLKIFYLFKRRLYLEHLVVALYSHAFLLLSLLAIFASMALRHAFGAQVPWLGTAFGWFEGLLWLSMPIYLLLMQKAVYRQGWPMTLLKYAVLGTVYFMLLTFGALATFFYSLVRM